MVLRHVNQLASPRNTELQWGVQAACPNPSAQEQFHVSIFQSYQQAPRKQHSPQTTKLRTAAAGLGYLPSKAVGLIVLLLLTSYPEAQHTLKALRGTQTYV